MTDQVTPPTAAPAPAPVAAAAPVAAPAAPIQPAPQPAAFVSSGDAALDLALGFFAKHGVAQEDLAMQSAKAGDFSVLSAVLQEKGVEGAQAYVEIAKQAHARKAAGEEAQKAARTATIHGVMGSEENWLAVKAFVADTATPAELAEINSTLNAGGLAAKATAKYLRDAYEKGTGNSLGGQTAPAAPPEPSPVAAATVRASSQAATSSSPMSPSEFQAEIKRLVAEKGAGAYASSEYAAALSRAQAFRGR